MIAKLTGTVDEILNDSIVLNVHDVGYQILVTKNLLSTIKLNQLLSLKIFHIFKESEQYLCGFDNIDELEIFKILLNVHGIGAKSALSILSSATLDILVSAINNQDASIFSSIKGIGTKTARLIILELKDKLPQKRQINTNNNIVNDAVLALVNLGYQRNSIIKLVSDTVQSFPNDDLNKIIVKCLHQLSSL